MKMVFSVEPFLLLYRLVTVALLHDDDGAFAA